MRGRILSAVVGALLAWSATAAKGTPQPIVEKIDKALEASLVTADIRDKLDQAGCEARSAPLSAFADIIRDDVALWARVIKEAGITAEQPVS